MTILKLKNRFKNSLPIFHIRGGGGGTNKCICLLWFSFSLEGATRFPILPQIIKSTEEFTILYYFDNELGLLQHKRLKNLQEAEVESKSNWVWAQRSAKSKRIPKKRQKKQRRSLETNTEKTD